MAELIKGLDRWLTTDPRESIADEFNDDDDDPDEFEDELDGDEPELDGIEEDLAGEDN